MKSKLIVLVLFTALFINCGDDDDLIIRDPQEQLEIDQALIDEYLEERNINAQIEPNTGLRYVIEEQGTGEKPKISDRILVNYEGRVMGASKNFDEGDASEFLLSTLIIAWRIGLPLIQEGGKIIMYVPSGYGYGIQGNPPEIDGNENLIFEVELLEIVQ